MPAPRKYSEEQRQEVVRLRKEGLSIKECSEKTGVSFATCRLFLKDVKLPDSVRMENIKRATGRTFLSPEDKQQVAEDYRVSGAKDAADKHGLTPAQVKHIAFELGVKVDSEVKKAVKSENAKAYWNDKEAKVSLSIRSTKYWSSMVKVERDQKVGALRGAYAGWLASLGEDGRRNLRDKAGQKAAEKVLAHNGFASWQDYFVALAAEDNTTVHSQYVDTYQKMEFVCDSGHQYSMRANNFQQGQRCPTCSAGRHASKGQLEVLEYVRSFFPQASSAVINGVECDIFVPAMRLAIEYNGLFWHSEMCTEKYGNNVAGRHHKKWKALSSAGVDLLAVYEDEWRNKQPLAKAMIRSRLGVSDAVKLDARKLELRKLFENSDFASFFKENHLDGHAKADFGFGLFWGEQLVAAVSVRKNFNSEWEIARFATRHGYIVRGGAGRLIAAIQEGPLVSFSNNRLSNGKIYRTLGFRKVSDNRPSYWYTDGATRVWRFSCKKDNTPEIVAKFPTEKEQARGGVFSKRLFGDDRPLYRVEDYGHQKWVRDAIPSP